MRCFLERQRRLCHLKFGESELYVSGKVGPAYHPDQISTIGICLAGGGGGGAPNCSARLDEMLQTCFIFDVVDMISLRRQNLPVKLPALRDVGKWLATKPTSNVPH
jgi:hypothetical protein